MQAKYQTLETQSRQSAASQAGLKHYMQPASQSVRSEFTEMRLSLCSLSLSRILQRANKQCN